MTSSYFDLLCISRCNGEFLGGVHKDIYLLTLASIQLWALWRSTSNVIFLSFITLLSLRILGCDFPVKVVSETVALLSSFSYNIALQHFWNVVECILKCCGMYLAIFFLSNCFYLKCAFFFSILLGACDWS